MSIEAILLLIFVSTFYFTSIVGVESELGSPITPKALYALWVWLIYLTFPGTYAMQPAVTSQTFGPKDAGTIYAFLFSSDIINNLMVATLSDALVVHFGYLGLFL